MIQIESVSSGHISAVGYDLEDETMVVRFQNGDEYAYSGVPFDTYESIKEAPSVGRALNASGYKGCKL